MEDKEEHAAATVNEQRLEKFIRVSRSIIIISKMNFYPSGYNLLTIGLYFLYLYRSDSE